MSRARNIKIGRGEDMPIHQALKNCEDVYETLISSFNRYTTLDRLFIKHNARPRVHKGGVKGIICHFFKDAITYVVEDMRKYS